MYIFVDYLELECLLSHFNDPCIMDVKMGTRTYLKNEVSLENKSTQFQIITFLSQRT